MMVAGGRDEMRTPVARRVPLARSAVQTFERYERLRPAVHAVMLLTVIALLLPGAPVWAGVFLGSSVVILNAGFRRAAYRFVGTPDERRQELADLWGLTSIASALFALPLLSLVIGVQMALNTMA